MFWSHFLVEFEFKSPETWEENGSDMGRYARYATIVIGHGKYRYMQYLVQFTLGVPGRESLLG